MIFGCIEEIKVPQSCVSYLIVLVSFSDWLFIIDAILYSALFRFLSVTPFSNFMEFFYVTIVVKHSKTKYLFSSLVSCTTQKGKWLINYIFVIFYKILFTYLCQMETVYSNSNLILFSSIFVSRFSRQDGKRTNNLYSELHFQLLTLSSYSGTKAFNLLSAKPHKMVKHAQTIRRIVWVFLTILWGWLLKRLTPAVHSTFIHT